MSDQIINEHARATNVDLGLMPFLKKNYNIKSILDVGCGPGGHVKYCKSIGLDAFGIDGDYNTIPKQKNFKFVDYRISSSGFNRIFDLGWSVEFAEHIEERYIENFVKDYLKCKILIFTAAPAGWGGVGHVNEQSIEYWISKLKEDGFSIHATATKEIRALSSLSFNNQIRARRKQFVKNRGLLFVNNLFKDSVDTN